MRAASLSAAWAHVPAQARRRLAQAATGRRHLALAGADCLAAGRSAGNAGAAEPFFALAASILLWAFGENPLSGPLAASLLAAGDLPLSEASRAMLAAVARGWRNPGPQGAGMALFRRLAAARDDARLADLLLRQMDHDSDNLFWREKALGLSLALGTELPEARASLEAAALAGLDAGALAPAAGLLRSQAAFLRGDADACRHELTNPPPVFGPAFAPARCGLALLAAGEEAAAAPLLFRALRSAPWQASLAGVLDAALCGGRRELAAPAGPVLIMLYTWNKAGDLDATLASLFASDLCGGRVLVLDNGSTDATPRILDAWEARTAGRLTRITLPTNIGAPAARNWLAATPAARRAASLVYLDDDVALPADWLRRLGAAQKRFPDAGVVGCSTADRRAPHLLQNVAGQLVIPPEAPADRPDLDLRSLAPNPFRLLNAHLEGPDWGLFAEMKPCTSVTGCCHMFRRSALDAPFSAGGGFALGLGPSQYDDFERDLRMAAAGGFAVHTGHLVVRHAKRSGIASQSGKATANALGNRYKMQTMHPRAEIAASIEKQDARLAAHVEDALRRLDAAGPSLQGEKTP